MQPAISVARPRVKLLTFEVRTLQIPELCKKVSKTFPFGGSVKQISMLEILILIFGIIKHSAIKPKNITSMTSHEEGRSTHRQRGFVKMVDSFFLIQSVFHLCHWLVKTNLFDRSQQHYYLTKQKYTEVLKCYFVHLLQKLKNILIKFISIEENLA